MVNFSWKPKNFKHAQIKDNQYDIFNFGKNSDHSYASPKMLKCQSGEEDEDIDGIDYSRIFDCEGNWTKEHKRAIINVMDCYHISHEAYHELRLAGKGHFPPLYQIRIEKSKMSGEIPFIKHPTVGFIIVSIGLIQCRGKVLFAHVSDILCTGGWGWPAVMQSRV